MTKDKTNYLQKIISAQGSNPFSPLSSKILDNVALHPKVKLKLKSNGGGFKLCRTSLVQSPRKVKS